MKRRVQGEKLFPTAPLEHPQDDINPDQRPLFPRRISRRCVGSLCAVLALWAFWMLYRVSIIRSSSGPPNKLEEEQPGQKSPASPARVLYSRTRGDRAGSAILDRLMAHAYAFRKGRRYGGACGNVTFPTLQHQETLVQKALGLQSELPLACPDVDQDSYEILEYDTYASVASKTFTNEWLTFIRSQSQTRRPLLSQRKNGIFSLVVHVRRGDVTLCGHKFKRYFTNQYYLELIDEYKPKDGRPVNVTIFSNLQDPEAHNAHEPREPWEDFTSIGYQVLLGTDMVETWHSMMTADVLILSKSGFSHVPGMFNEKGKVIYSPYWTEPVPGWTVVTARTRARQLMQQARKKYCK